MDGNRGVSIDYNGTRLGLAQSTYVSGDTLALMAYCREEGGVVPYGNVSVNFGMTRDGNYVFVDTNNMPGIDKALEEAGIARATGVAMPSGYCVYPEMEVNGEALALMEHDVPIAALGHDEPSHFEWEQLVDAPVLDDVIENERYRYKIDDFGDDGIPF